jgi:hypothetical protein
MARPNHEVDIDQYLRNLPQGRDEDLIRRHREAGISMFGSDPHFPGSIVELAPDGKYFIGNLVDNVWVRVQEVDPPPQV